MKAKHDYIGRRRIGTTANCGSSRSDDRIASPSFARSSQW